MSVSLGTVKSLITSMLVGHRNRVDEEFAFCFLSRLVVGPRVSVQLAVLVRSRSGRRALVNSRVVRDLSRAEATERPFTQCELTWVAPPVTCHPFAWQLSQVLTSRLQGQGSLFRTHSILIYKVGLAAHAYNPRTWQVEAGGSGIQGHPYP